METSTEKIIRLLLMYPKKKWKQVELARRAECSKAFLSKFTKRMITEGVLARPKSQELVLLSNAKLLNMWCSIRKLPQPIYIKTKFSKAQIERMLKKEEDYCLTLFSAAWHRIKFMKTNTIETYVLKGKVRNFIKKFGIPMKSPTSFSVFPSGNHVFEGREKVNGLYLVPIVQNYIDLMSSGGTGSIVAHELGEKYNLRGI